MSDLPDEGAATGPLLLACLCAQWCGTCRDYLAVFDALRSDLGTRAVCAWVDIEDDDAVLGALDVENFPTLLIARGDVVLFFGPITPQPQTLARLVQSAIAGDLKPVANPALAGLPGRVRGLTDALGD